MARLIGFRRFLCVAVGAVTVLGGRVAPAEPLRFVAYPAQPYIDLQNHDAPGFNVEVFRAVLAVMGREVAFEELPLPRGSVMVQTGERDGIFLPLSDGLRRSFCLFPDEPLAQARWVVFIRTADAGKLKFSSFDDLVGHDIAIAYRAHRTPELSEFLREHPDNIVRAPAARILSMLAAGRVDYAIMNLAVGMREIRTTQLSGKVEPLLSRSVMETSFSACFSKARVEPAFVDAFSSALKQFKETEAFQGIYRKYFP